MGRSVASSGAASSAGNGASESGVKRLEASNAVGKRRRGAGPRLSDLQRLEIIRRRQSSSSTSSSSSLVTLRRLAREFGVNEKTIRRVMENADEIERRASCTSIAGRAHAFRRPAPKFPELERRLVQWVDAQQRSAAHAPSERSELSPSAVIDQAKRLAQALGISEDQFKGSWGWYDKFCKRYGLRAAVARSQSPGTSSSVVDALPDGQRDAASGCDDVGDAVGSGGVGRNDTDEASLGACKGTGVNTNLTARASTSDAIRSAEDLRAVIAQYDPNWVFTVDETALFYDYLPPLIRPADSDAAHEDSNAARWTTLAERLRRRGILQDSHDMVTLVTCCNSTGTLSLPVTMIGKPRLPARAVPFPLPYLQQEHSWMDRVTFTRWFDTVFCAFIRSNNLSETLDSGEKRKVLLVVDGDRPGYQAGFEQEGIRVVSIPTKHSDSRGQDRNSVKRSLGPLLRGALMELKRRYKHLVLRDAISFHTAPAEVQRMLLASAKSVRKEEVGVHFGRPPTLLDAARNAALAWSQVFDRVRYGVSFQRVGIIPMTGCEESEDGDGIADEMKRLLSAHVSAFHQHRQPATVDNCRQTQLPINEVSRQVDEFLRIDNDESPVLQQALQHELHQQLGDGNGQVASSTTHDTGDSGDKGQVSPLDGRSGPSPAVLPTSRAALLGAAQLGIYLRGVSPESLNASRDSSVRDLESELEGSIQAADQLRRFLQRLDAYT